MPDYIAIPIITLLVLFGSVGLFMLFAYVQGEQWAEQDNEEYLDWYFKYMNGEATLADDPSDPGMRAKDIQAARVRSKSHAPDEAVVQRMLSRRRWGVGDRYVYVRPYRDLWRDPRLPETVREAVEIRTQELPQVGGGDTADI